jgi:hypothetical protein
MNSVCPPLQQALQRALNNLLRLRINTAGCLIQNQNSWISQQCPRKRQQLPLSRRQIRPTFAYFCLIVMFLSQNKFFCANCFRCLDHGFIRCVQLPITDIFHDRAREQMRFLQYHAHLSPQAILRHFADLISINRQATAVNVIQAHHQLDDG